MSDSSVPTPLCSTRVIPARRRHMEAMIDCHMAAFGGEFTTLLGRGCLRASHRYFIDQPDGISLVCVDEETGRVAGLVKGGRPELRAAFVKTHILRFLGACFCKFFIHRRVRRRLGEHFVEALRKKGRRLHLVPAGKYVPPPEDPPGTWSNLISICVHPDFQGRGIGRILMEAFRGESARRGYKTMRVSVHNDNDAAIALYKKSGWKPILTTPRGTYFKRSVEEQG